MFFTNTKDERLHAQLAEEEVELFNLRRQIKDLEEEKRKYQEKYKERATYAAYQSDRIHTLIHQKIPPEAIEKLEEALQDLFTVQQSYFEVCAEIEGFARGVGLQFSLRGSDAVFGKKSTIPAFLDYTPPSTGLFAVEELLGKYKKAMQEPLIEENPEPIDN
jgi:hypothetical protein